MIKSILKEIFISIGLCLTIALVMAIMFYEYIPMQQTIPKISKYVRTESLEEELRITTEQQEVSKTIVTYDVGKSELNGYEKTKKYVAGKPNPFATFGVSGTVGGNVQTSENTEANSSNGNSSNGSSNNTNTTDNDGEGIFSKDSTNK